MSALVTPVQLDDIRREIRAEESDRAEDLLRQLRDAHRVVWIIVTQLGGTAKLSDAEVAGVDPASTIEMTYDPYERVTVLRARKAGDDA